MVYTPGRPRVDLELPAIPTSVTTARRAVSDLAGKVGAAAGDVALAVSEAVGNAVTHAFRDRPPGTIRVIAARRRNQLVVKVIDDGTGMVPNVDSPGLGLGISVISKLARDVRFDSSERGTTVAMSFAIDRRPGGAAK
jgi:serine/threonine-protein kinase RsbW/stage II sporulation protein AB (anti-sigma F factor)